MKTSFLTVLSICCLLAANAQNGTARWTRIENVPVLRPQLTAFRAIETSKTISLNWSTSSEKNSSYFIVERSRNGVAFDSVGAVTALGRFDLPTSYEFIDLQPLAGNRYYRLRIVELDGTQVYGKVYKVTSGKEISEPRSSVATK
jgi:hypothetical protein